MYYLVKQHIFLGSNPGSSYSNEFQPSNQSFWNYTYECKFVADCIQTKKVSVPMQFACCIPRNSWNINVRQLLQNTSVKPFSKPAQRTGATKEDMSMDQVQLQKKALLSSARSLAILKSIYYTEQVGLPPRAAGSTSHPDLYSGLSSAPVLALAAPEILHISVEPDPTIAPGSKDNNCFFSDLLKPLREERCTSVPSQ